MRIFILLAILGAALAVPKQRGSRIVGGENAEITTYPYMANMQYGLYGIWWFHWCGGSLLTTTLVLSAAQCFEDDPVTSWRVLLGSSSVTSGGSEHYVSSIIKHENFNERFLNNDIALVRLVNSATYSDTVQAVRIAAPNYILADGAAVYAIGWGELESGSNTFPDQLQHVEVNIVNWDTCATNYAYLKTLSGYENLPDVSDRMLCAGVLDVGGKDSCDRDTGGPLSHVISGDTDVILGVRSWGAGCGQADYPGVYASVAYFSDWIVANA